MGVSNGVVQWLSAAGPITGEVQAMKLFVAAGHRRPLSATRSWTASSTTLTACNSPQKACKKKNARTGRTRALDAAPNA
jgi:hypothetical protein